MFELKQTLTLLQTIKQIHLLLIRIKKKKKINQPKTYNYFKQAYWYKHFLFFS